MKLSKFSRFGLAVILAVVSVLTAASAQAITFVQWTTASGGNGHYYGITSSATDWNNAEMAAVSLGGTLATITSAGEESFVTNTFLTSGPYSDVPLWLGLNDVANGIGSKSYTKWVTGETVAYTDWNTATGEPTNSPPGEDYVAINWHFSLNNGSPVGTWNDTPEAGTTGYGGNSNGPYFGIVEVVPEPATYGFVLAGAGLLLVGRRFRARQAGL